MGRYDGRSNDQLRPIRITTGFTGNAPGSVLIEIGETRVLCTAMIEEKVPPFIAGSGKGWLTAEYSMLPSSTQQRKKRENYKNGPDGRSIEIQRLIGRSLRCAVDLSKLGEHTIQVDCDVLQADGGTRTASITGGYVAVAIAVNKLLQKQELVSDPMLKPVTAISVGIVENVAMLDLCYLEDSIADADMNIVMTTDGFVEIQGTGEKAPIGPDALHMLLDMSKTAIDQIRALQIKAIDRAKEEML